jgi:hypothetical protein
VVKVIVLVTSDREIRGFRLRQAAAVSDLLGRSGVADVVGLPHEQRVDDP